MDLGLIFGILSTVGILGIVVSIAGPGGILIILTALKTALAYGWKVLTPLYVVLRQKALYKVVAVGLSFANFWIYLYSFLQTGNQGALGSAMNALGATLVGGFNQMTTAGYIMLANPTDPVKILGGLLMLVLGFSSIMLWFIGWRMMKRRVPELTYYILVAALMFAMAWGMNELNAIFEVTDLAKAAADTATGNSSVNASEQVNQTASKSFSLLGS